MIPKWSEGDYILERICGENCPCNSGKYYTHLNMVKNYTKPLDDMGSDPPTQLPDRKMINVRGRLEHEAVIRDAALCAELGLDQMYETMVYLKRWGGWLRE